MQDYCDKVVHQLESATAEANTVITNLQKLLASKDVTIKQLRYEIAGMQSKIYRLEENLRDKHDERINMEKKHAVEIGELQIKIDNLEKSFKYPQQKTASGMYGKKI